MKKRAFHPALEQLEVRAVPAVVTFHGGPVLPNVQVEPVFYGSYWATPAGAQEEAELDTYLNYLVTSPFMDELAEYSAGHGSLPDTGITDTSISGPSTVSDSRIRTMINTHVTQGTIAAPNANRLYLVYTAPNVVVRDDGENSLLDFAGYHDSFTGTGGATIVYDVIPSPVGNGDLPGLTDFQTLTEVTSHELSEAATNPTGNGWYSDSSGDEIADLANGEDGTLNGYVITGLWSEQRQQIVLPSGSAGLGIVAPPNLTSVANQLTHSMEAYQLFVTDAYEQYLGRAPDAGGLSYWVGQMQSGTTDEQIEASFIGSAEYIKDHGGSNAGWVAGMYQNLLGRAPTTAEVNYWVGQLAAGESTSAVAYGFAASTERESERVAADYTTYLGRPATSAEISYWVGQFENGVTNEDVVAGFVGSFEYYVNPNKGQGQPGDWIKSLYQDVLHRAPSAVEVQGWLPSLEE